MAPSLRKRKSYYIPGVGHRSKTKCYLLQIEELARHEASLATSTSTPLSPCSPASAAASISSLGIVSHDDEDIMECQSSPSSVVPVDHSSISEVGVGEMSSVDEDRAYLDDESDYDKDRELSTSYLMGDDDEDVDEECDEDERADDPNRTIILEQFKVELALWLSNSRNSRTLLKLLREVDRHSVFAKLPKDLRSLLPKPDLKTVLIPRSMEPGEYAYPGARVILSDVMDTANKDMVRRVVHGNTLDPNLESRYYGDTASRQSFQSSLHQTNFSGNSDLRSHAWATPSGYGLKPFQCDVCQKTFSSRDILQLHLQIHAGNRPFQCNVCQKTFIQKGDLNKHLQIHAGDRPFECDVCHKTFVWKYCLKSHLQIHAGDRPFECDVCQKTFIRKGDLNQHLQIHVGDRPFECDVCQKTFVRKYCLRIHLRIHAGDRPFECNVCQKTFIQKSHLNNHLQIHARG